MKVFFDHDNPFLLAHGGFQIQIEQTKLALERAGVEVDWLRWWDDSQAPDIIHFFGRPPSAYLQQVRAKGIKLVMSELRTGAGSRPLWKLNIQAVLNGLARRGLPPSIVSAFGLDVYQLIDAAIALTPWEAEIMQMLSACPPERLHIVPNGVEEEFFDQTPVPPLDWLVCTATIHPRKRPLELARAAVLAQTPTWIIGKPYAESDPYHREFLEVARAHPQWVRYEGAINDRRRLAEIYRGARGFVLISTMESLSLSALEAAASRCPLLLSELPWATSTFAGHARFCPASSEPAVIAPHLRQLWEASRTAMPPFVPLRWSGVAEQLRAVYEQVLKTSR